MADRYQQLFAALPYPTLVEDAAGVIAGANPAAARLLNYPLEELLGRPHRDFLTTSSAERLQPQRAQLAAKQRLQLEVQYVARGGLLYNVIIDISALPPDGADGGACLIVARECSRLDELERELRLQRQSAHARYRNDLHATFFISARNEISPYPPQAPGEPPRPLDWVHALLLGPQFRTALGQAWNGEEVLLPPAWYRPGGSGSPARQNSTAAKFTTHDRARWLKIGLFPVRSRGTEISDICVQTLDCTADYLSREEQRRVDQCIASSLLTAALHNELNSYLNVVIAQASGLRLSMPAGHLPPPHVGAIMDAARNAAALLRHSAEKSPHNSGALTEVDINSLASDCAHLLPHLALGRIQVELELSPGLPAVRGDARALKTLFLELLYHAGKRVPHGGKLLLKTYRGKPAGPGVPPPAGISIQENTPRGSQAAESQPQAAPARDSDTSLELALARAILREHRGQLEITASALQGNTCDILLPGIDARPLLTDPSPVPAHHAGDEALLEEQLAQTAAAPADIPAAPAPVAARSRQTKILLVDDEENFLAFTSWILKEHGFEVVVASDGQEAFERFQETPQSFHLAVMDAYMPRMGGLEAYLRMQVLRPDLPVIFASGFVRGASVDALMEGCPGPAGVLLKPFTSEELLNAVSKALSHAGV